MQPSTHYFQTMVVDGTTCSTTSAGPGTVPCASFVPTFLHRPPALVPAPAPCVMSSSSAAHVLGSAVQTEVGVSLRLFAKRAAAPLAATALQAAMHNDNHNDNTTTVPPPPPDEPTQPQQQQQQPQHSFIIRLLWSRRLPPRTQSIVSMAGAMALHFGGYEFVRSSALALLTSPTRGFRSPAAFPLAMALVSPCSLLLVLRYSHVLDRQGPKVALRQSTLGSLLVLLLSGVGLAWLGQDPPPILTTTSTPTTLLLPSYASKALVAFVFLFSNSYAHLLYSQHWSFLGSIMTPREGSKWFATIAGLCSLSCTLAGTTVPWWLNHVGLPGLLWCGTTLALAASWGLGEHAYGLAERYGFDPAVMAAQEQDEPQQQEQQPTSSSNNNNNNNRVSQARALFRREPKLGALFAEVLTFQSLSTILHVCLVTKLKATIANDVARAAWTANFYAAVNAVSGAFQFVILPVLFSSTMMEPRMAWRFMPVLPLLCSLFQSVQVDPSLYLLAFSFFAAKCMDYSFRSVANEMVYVPLDFESRYVGKEIVGVFGNRFGKSGMSLLLSGLTYAFGNFGVPQLSLLSTAASVAWLASGWNLSRLVPTQDEAQHMVDERRLQTNTTTTTRAEGDRDTGGESKSQDSKPKQS